MKFKCYTNCSGTRLAHAVMFLRCNLKITSVWISSCAGHVDCWYQFCLNVSLAPRPFAPPI